MSVDHDYINRRVQELRTQGGFGLLEARRTALREDRIRRLAAIKRVARDPALMALIEIIEEMNQ